MVKFRFVTLLGCLLLASNLFATTYYLSPSGNDSNDGSSSENAKFSLRLLVNSVSAGDTILMEGGTYNYDSTINVTNSGTATANIYILAASMSNRPVLNFSSINCNNDEDIRAYARGFRITGDYWYFKGIEICYAPDNGIKCEGSHNTFDQCLFHHNNDSGIQIGFWKEGDLVDNSSGELCAYNLVLNCDSYRNADAIYYDDNNVAVADTVAYENADGFACKLFAGKGNVFYGCRAWENCDDGWDFYMTKFEIKVENCWSWHNGDYSIWGVDSSKWNGDGNGFKLGGKDTASPNIAIRCIAFDAYSGAMCGFNSNNNGAALRVYNCTAWHCGKNFKLVDQAHIIKNCIAFDPTTSNKKNFNADLTDSLVISSHNSWDSTDFAITPSYDDLVSTSSEDFLADRQSDGSLPDNGFGRLASTSDCINIGTTDLDVTLTYVGSAPDLGAYEYGATTSVYRTSKDQKLVAVRNISKNTSVYYVNLIGSRVGKVMNYSVVNNKTVLTKLGSGVYYRVIPGTAAEKVANVNKK